MDSRQKVIVSILEYLQSVKGDAADASNVENALAILEEEFGLVDQAESFKEHSYYPTSLSEIFEAGTTSLNAQTYADANAEAKSNPKFESFVEVVNSKGYFDGAEEGSVEYLKRYAKLIKKFKEKAAKVAGPSSEELQTQADELKFKGNAAINAKNYEEAIQCYTEALSLVSDGPESHVYHSNRAAAYCYLKKYQEAVDDCEACISLAPDYIKAHSRLGLANFFLERYDDAVAAYERALEIEPDNKATQDSLKQARNKLRKVATTSSTGSKNTTTPSGGMDSLPAGIPPSMLKNPAVKQAMDQMGGPAGLASLMKDPQMMAMAQQMMKDPAMMQQAMSMLGGGGGGGGMPDMSALAGLMGGMGGAGCDVPSSSSSAGGKKPFRGFED